ncbi:MAG: NotI family restriction endonuclease [Telluria sp.]
MATKKLRVQQDPNTPKKPRIPKDLSPRFGIGEWFGKSVILMTGEERRNMALEVLKPKAERTKQPCPFQATKEDATCSKEGGVCSLRMYSYGKHATGRAMGIPVDGAQGALRATCPYRFHDAKKVFNWVGEVILEDGMPHLVGEVGFLEAGATTDAPGGDDVGRIDMVLVSSKTAGVAKMEWGALEIQAVYFSGNAMRSEFKAYADETCDWVIL